MLATYNVKNVPYPPSHIPYMLATYNVKNVPYPLIKPSSQLTFCKAPEASIRDFLGM